MARTLQPTRDAESAVLAVARRAQERLPDRDASLAERLFALECAARGGRAVAPVVERYRDALREAEWWLDEEWEPDVPHAVVVAQALSAMDALGEDSPAAWSALLTDALQALQGRRTRYGLGGDPALLAAVLRGLGASGETPPEWLLSAASDALNARGSASATAELAEALARHSTGARFAPRALAAAFAGTGDTDPDAAYAQWWLAGRRHDIGQHLNVRAVDDARLRALMAADPVDPKAAAMVMEAASRAAGNLVIASPESINAARSRQERALLVSRAAYRGLFFGTLLIVVLAKAHSIAHALASGGEAHAYHQCIVGLCWVGFGFCISGTADACARAFGRKQPEWARYAEVAATVVAGIIAGVTA